MADSDLVRVTADLDPKLVAQLEEVRSKTLRTRPAEITMAIRAWVENREPSTSAGEVA